MFPVDFTEYSTVKSHESDRLLGICLLGSKGIDEVTSDLYERNVPPIMHLPNSS